MIDCTNAEFDQLAAKEWIVANGIGGYASSSITGTNTRRYHGVLVASFNPPTERMVLVSKVDETIYYGGRDIPLSSNEYDTGIHPEGYRHLRAFTRSPLPQYDFQCDALSLRKTIFMVYGRNATVIEYQNTGKFSYLLKLNPLYVYRDYHSLWHQQVNYNFQLKTSAERQTIFAYYGAHPLYFSHKGCAFKENRYWNYRLVYRIDKERGQGFMEDTYSLGMVERHLAPGEKVHLIFSLETDLLDRDPTELMNAEQQRLNALVPESIKNDFVRDLVISGDQFIVQRRTTENYSVIAGYHWFTDWGRDSMIAIRGLCIATGKQEVARSVISTFLAYISKGIIPNRFPDYQGDMAEYNTVDASLWLFVTLYEYDRQFGDTAFLKQVQRQLLEILEWHIRGTFHNIKVGENGLLGQGAPHVQLTWMDARIRDTLFTPRHGYAVEVNALWYNALKVYQHVCARLKLEVDKKFGQLCRILEENYTKLFWNQEGYLNDVINLDGGVDSAIRPNQVYAVSLPFSPINEQEQKSVLACIKRELLTPYGLRTLAPRHPDFRPRYAGDLWSRDGAYHQGTTWPFLLPEYFLAYLKLNNYSDAAKQEAAAFLQPLKEHFYQKECLYGISEIFDGLEPETGKGCAHQAWSVSNVLLLLLKTGINV